VCGVSGSGKSTLVIDTIGRRLAPKKQTTSVAYEPIEPLPFDSMEHIPESCVVIDQARAGVHSPVAYLGLESVLSGLFSESAVEAGLDESLLTRRCEECRGTGTVTTDMGFLPPIHAECEACSGTGFPEETQRIRVRGSSLSELYSLTCEEVYELWGDEDSMTRRLKAAIDVGLGYLALRQPTHALSGGELQRLKIARHLSKTTKSGTLFILDEPSVGLHQTDVAALSESLAVLRRSGHTVIVVEHNPLLLAGCDWLLELGPGGGHEGGSLVFAGTPKDLAVCDTPTAPYLREVLSR
jgi:excinuclease ABC subunit A